MPGPEVTLRPRGIRRGAALTLVFAAVLVTAAATDCWQRDEVKSPSLPSRSIAATADREEVAAAAARAMADGKSGKEAAEEVVSRSGDRWGAVYDPAEYEEFTQALDGEYTGVGLRVERVHGGRIEVTRVQSGGPAGRAGVREGDRLRTIDGRPVANRPVTEVVGLLRDARRGRAAPSSSAWSAVRASGARRCAARASPPRPSPWSRSRTATPC